MEVSEVESDSSETSHLTEDISSDEGEVISGNVVPYANEPLASNSSSDEENEECEDEDQLPPSTLAKRFDGEIKLDEWLVKYSK